MTLIERVIHLFLFEILALLLMIPALFHHTNIPFYPFLILLLAVSGIAMVWHAIVNLIFDQYHGEPREVRTWMTRIQFTMWFKVSLVLFTTPMIAIILEVSLKDAFVLDCIFSMFGMIYTLLFNYCYDHCRLYFLSLRSVRSYA